MVGFNEERSRFYLSDECYIDMVNHQIITPNEKPKVLNGQKWAILELLAKNSPNRVDGKILFDTMMLASNKDYDTNSGAYNVDDLRRPIYALRHLCNELLYNLIQNISGGYRLIWHGYDDREAIDQTSAENTDPSAPTVIDFVSLSSDSPSGNALDAYKSTSQHTEDSSPTLIGVVSPTNPTACTLIDKKITTRPNFVEAAREDTFASLDEAFSEHHVVFIYGLGGIGKSEIAKHWAIRKKKAGIFETVVFAQLNTEENNCNVMSLINDDITFVISGNFHNRGDTFSSGREETADEYFHRKLAQIMKICDEKTLIIIDNYDIADPDLTKLFGGNFRLLVTTRTEYDNINYPFIHVGEIQSFEHLKTIFFNNLGNERDDISYDDPYIKKLFELVSNHTLAIEIIAKSLADSVEETPELLYRKMLDVGMSAFDDEVESYISQKALLPSECIRILFNLSCLESDEDYEFKVQVLSFMAAMPTRGIELGLFKKWSNNKTNRAAMALIKKSWLRKDTVDGITVISMHPLVREIVWCELEPSIEKCPAFIEKIKNDDYVYIDGLYHQSTDVKERYARVILSLLSSFPVCNLAHFDFYCRLQRALQICAKADSALRLANDLKCMLEEINETSSWRYAYVKFRIGAVYMTLYRNVKDGSIYLSEAEQLMTTTATTPKEKMWLAFLCRELATGYCRALFDDSLPNEPDKISLYLDKGLLIAEELIASGFSNLNLELYRGTIYVWRSKLEVFFKNLPAAKDYVAQAEAEFTRLGYSNTLDKAAIFDIRAQIHAIEGDYAAEVACLKESAEVFISGFGEYHRASIERAIKLALAYAKSGQLSDALKLLLHYKEIAVKMYGEASQVTIDVCDTLECLRNCSSN